MGSVMFYGVFNINWCKHLVSNPRHNKVRQIPGQMGNPRTIPFPLQLDGPCRTQGTWFVFSHVTFSLGWCSKLHLVFFFVRNFHRFSTSPHVFGPFFVQSFPKLKLFLDCRCRSFTNLCTLPPTPLPTLSTSPPRRASRKVELRCEVNLSCGMSTDLKSLETSQLYIYIHMSHL